MLQIIGSLRVRHDLATKQGQEFMYFSGIRWGRLKSRSKRTIIQNGFEWCKCSWLPFPWISEHGSHWLLHVLSCQQNSTCHSLQYGYKGLLVFQKTYLQKHSWTISRYGHSSYNMSCRFLYNRESFRMLLGHLIGFKKYDARSMFHILANHFLDGLASKVVVCPAVVALLSSVSKGGTPGQVHLWNSSAQVHGTVERVGAWGPVLSHLLSHLGLVICHHPQTYSFSSIMPPF